MAEPAEPGPSTSSPPPPRAFTQGVGTVFQFTGVSVFIASMFVCCSSSLLSSSTAIRPELTRIGWGAYSVQRAMTISLAATVFFGIALAGLGLGLQAMRRRTPIAAVFVTAIATIFYLVHAVFFALTISAWKGSWPLAIVSAAMGMASALLLALSASALREMRRNPPPPDFEVLPKDYVVPYSHMHQDPPEVRIAQELAQRRDRLAVQQKELELLEEKLKRKLKQKEE